MTSSCYGAFNRTKVRLKLNILQALRRAPLILVFGRAAALETHKEHYVWKILSRHNVINY